MNAGRGLSGAELSAAVREAAMMALEQSGFAAPYVEWQHLERALAAAERRITPQMMAFYQRYQQRHTHNQDQVGPADAAAAAASAAASS